MERAKLKKEDFERSSIHTAHSELQAEIGRSHCSVVLSVESWKEIIRKLRNYSDPAVVQPLRKVEGHVREHVNSEIDRHTQPIAESLFYRNQTNTCSRPEEKLAWTRNLIYFGCTCGLFLVMVVMLLTRS